MESLETDQAVVDLMPSVIESCSFPLESYSFHMDNTEETPVHELKRRRTTKPVSIVLSDLNQSNARICVMEEEKVSDCVDGM